MGIFRLRLGIHLNKYENVILLGDFNARTEALLRKRSARIMI